MNRTFNYIFASIVAVIFTVTAALSSFAFVPNDYHYDDYQWNLKKINMEQAWDILNRSDYSNVKIGVIDSGMNCFINNSWRHPDLYNDYGYEYVMDPSCVRNFHGTAVAGVIMANMNNIGIAGVIQKPTAYHYRASNNTTGDTRIDRVTDAINLARLDGVQIINLSSSFSEATHLPVEIANLKTACMNFPGLIVTSAGNNSGQNIDVFKMYPASFDLLNIIVVGATNASDNRASLSNKGPVSVDLFAPGENILTTYPIALCNGGIAYDHYAGTHNTDTHVSDGYHTVQGTSFAAPQVTGVAAMIKALRPSFTTAQIKAAILDSADQKASLSGLCVTGGFQF